MCEEYLSFDFKTSPRKLSYILTELKNAQINTIYVSNKSEFDDYQNIVIKYLSDKGNFIITPKIFNALFRDSQHQNNSLQVIQIIAQEHRLNVVDLNNIQSIELKDMRMDKQEFSSKVITQLSAIEIENNIDVNIARFSKTSKPVVKFQNEYFINYEHPAFQSLLLRSDKLSNKAIKTYFLGLLGVQI